MKYTFTKKNVTESNRAYLFAELFICKPSDPVDPATPNKPVLNGGQCLNEGLCYPEGALDLICPPKE